MSEGKSGKTLNLGDVVWGAGVMTAGALVCLGAFLLFDFFVFVGLLCLYGLTMVFAGYMVLSDGIGKKGQRRESRTSPIAREQPYPAETKREVWTRDGGSCVLCDAKTDLRFGLVGPDRDDGSNPANLRVVCGTCEGSMASPTQSS